jgi:cytochrome c553
LSRISNSLRRRPLGPLAVVVAFSLLGLGGQAANAQQLDGRALADACTSCHGIDGHSIGSIPSLAGVDKATLLGALKGFRTDTSATIMNRIVQGYTDAELEAIAEYFSQVKSK